MYGLPREYKLRLTLENLQVHFTTHYERKTVWSSEDAEKQIKFNTFQDNRTNTINEFSMEGLVT